MEHFSIYLDHQIWHFIKVFKFSLSMALVFMVKLIPQTFHDFYCFED